MSPRLPRYKVMAGVAIAVAALLTVTITTGPDPDEERTANFRRLGGPCLQLERWGLFGWIVIGQTHTLTQTTNGNWQEPQDNPPCQDVDDSLILVRMPLDASPDVYRLCGYEDDRACITFHLVEFESTGPGP
ncbi:MAG: hypothetical protein WDZ96_07075 [Acidimicrobiia bacterium]